MLFLSFDELPPAERPERRIWDDDEALNEHFEMVERNRDRDMKSPPIEDPVQNELTAGFRG